MDADTLSTYLAARVQISRTSVAVLIQADRDLDYGPWRTSSRPAAPPASRKSAWPRGRAWANARRLAAPPSPGATLSVYFVIEIP